MFAVHFDDMGGSTIEFGGYDSDQMARGRELIYLEAPYDPLWKVHINAFRVTDKPTFDNGAGTAFYFPEKEAVLDTFSPYIKIPSSISVETFALFMHGVFFNNTDSMLVGSCDLSLYHSISLFINDRYYFKIVPESFVTDIGYED